MTDALDVTWASLTPPQQEALRVVHAAGTRGCFTTSRSSRHHVNARAAESLRRLGLVRFGFGLTGDVVTATAAGCAVLAESV